MPVLHIINQTPQESTAFARCLDLIAIGDAIVLIENGVYAALRGVLPAVQLQVLADIHVFVLEPDSQVRALSRGNCVAGFECIDYPDFVDLVVAYDASISWC